MHQRLARRSRHLGRVNGAVQWLQEELEHLQVPFLQPQGRMCTQRLLANRIAGARGAGMHQLNALLMKLKGKA